ncbi:hypothetical protein BGX30_011448 [Mortierella sp. GBA39]|nr:hypothetical protein BGX30_011448 [Mortierella sp. GBA39]
MRAPASWMKSLLATATCLAFASIAQADILCSSPNTGQTFKAGDPVSLAITASATGGPFVAQVNTLTATLVCTVAGTILDTVTIPKANVTGYNYIIPSVGNVTTPTGTDGVCVTNKFYFSYSGKYTDDGIFPISHDFGPANPTPGDKGESESEGRPKTFIVVVVAIVAVVLLALMAVGIMFHLRRQRKRRMESAIMPWSNQNNNNQFSKMSSSMDDDDPRSPGSHHAAAIGGGVAAAGAVGAGFNKPQPKTPQPSHGGHYGDDSYGGGGYGQHQQHGHGGYYNDQDGYGQQQQDDFYNPYYAQHAGGGGGYQGAAGAAGAAAAGGYGYRNDKQSYYAGSQGARTPYQESHDPYSSASPPVSSAAGAGSAGGYYPPPPPVSGNAAGALSPPTPSSSYLNSAPNELSSTTLTNSSGTGRAPQAILPEMGHSEGGDAAGGGIPMKEIPPK